jgi:hypothetical protein
MDEMLRSKSNDKHERDGCRESRFVYDEIFLGLPLILDSYITFVGTSCSKKHLWERCNIGQWVDFEIFYLFILRIVRYNLTNKN